MSLSRRQFASSLVGMVALLGTPRRSRGSESQHGSTVDDEISRRARGAAETGARPPEHARASKEAAGGHGSKDAGPAPHRAASADEIWTELMEGNRRFVAGKLRARPLASARAALVQGQHPRAIVLGCSDSRVSPELVFDQSLGDLFVVRTAGNIADPVAMGSLEYAAEHLHAPVLVVLGHEKCGAVSAALGEGEMPTTGLRAVVGKIRPVIDKLRVCGTGDQLVALAVEANVHASARDLLEQSPILSEEVRARKLTIVKAVYQLRTGRVVRLG